MKTKRLKTLHIFFFFFPFWYILGDIPKFRHLTIKCSFQIPCLYIVYALLAILFKHKFLWPILFFFKELFLTPDFIALIIDLKFTTLLNPRRSVSFFLPCYRHCLISFNYTNKTCIHSLKILQPILFSLIPKSQSLHSSDTINIQTFYCWSF